MNKACLVTGAAGFIGSHLVDRLLELNYQVVGIDNLSLGKKENLSLALSHPQFTFYKQDLNEVDACVQFLSKHQTPWETIWHFAANSDIQAGVKNPDIDLNATFLTTYNALKIAKQLQISNFAFASTSAIYGQLPGAIKEDDGPFFPISSYGAMKLASEALISVGLESYLKQAWIFRFPNVVGSRATHGVIYDLIKKLKNDPNRLEVLGDGNQTKPYLHVSELIDALIFIYQKAQEKLNYYNIAPTNTTSVRNIVENLMQPCKQKPEIYYTGGSKGWDGDVPHFQYDTSKLSHLGWQAKLSSNEAVKNAVQEIWDENQ
jgi:UDP-glucose 4-epimerase